MEKDYKDYEASDFLNNRSFLEWIRHENTENDAFWRNWLRQHPEKSEAIRSAKAHYHLLTSFDKIKPDPGEYEEVWDKIEEGIDKQAGSRIHRIRIFRWVAGAAAILLLIGGWFAYKQMQLPKENFVIVKAENGKKEIVLADSSLVVLNRNAVLKYDADNCRELWLKGEAFFEVKHSKTAQDIAMPFMVHAGKEKVAVLGTNFTVKTIKNAARIVLLRGKVKVSVENQAILMKPGEKVEWEDGGFSTEKVNAKLYVAWKYGEFHFDHTSLKELKALVKDVYDYDLIIKNKSSLSTKTISGTVSEENEDILWKTIALMFNAKVEKKGKQIILTVP